MSAREVDPVLCPPAASAQAAAVAPAAPGAERLRGIVDRHYDFLWRAIRYLGVPDASAEDVAQQVLCVVARRIDQIEPAAEMSFLFATAMRAASEARRTVRRRHEAPGVHDLDTFVASGPTPEDLVDERRAHDILRAVIEAIPLDERLVFVLFELEERSMAEVAAMLGIPAGTVASRLRRGRETFRSIVRRMRAADTHTTRGGQK